MQNCKYDLTYIKYIILIIYNIVLIFQKICCPYVIEADCECPSCMQKLQSTIDYAFKLCGSIGLFFSFTEVKVHELFCILYTFKEMQCENLYNT